MRPLIFALLVVPALALVAFGPRADDTIPHGRVVVEYWEKWTGNEEQQMRQIVDAFNDTVGRDEEIYVRYLSTSSINYKTLVATAAGTPPDIAGLWDGNIVQYAALGAIEPLDAMAAEAGITPTTYKKVYWDSCRYDGRLYALVSTPAVVALHYNRVAFEENAGALRSAGFDPTRAPRTIAELDAYATALTRMSAGGRRIDRAGFLPMEPDWYNAQLCYWFGGSLFDPATGRFTLTDPKVIAAYEWLQGYPRRLSKEAATEFRSSAGNNWDSPQNPFLTGQLMMEQQGPWMANYIDHLRPELQRLRFSREEEMTRPLLERRENYFWAVAPFPSAVSGLENVCYAPFDALVIPRGAKHKREAFAFMAYLTRRDVMERLCKLHCKNSPLADVSDDFLTNHPNPYIDVFESLARSPNARGITQIPIWQEVSDEMKAVAERLTLLQTDPRTALAEAQRRLQSKYDDFLAQQGARKSSAR